MVLCMNIKRFREEKYISQEQLAEKLCMSKPTYSRLEKNESTCRKYLPQIAKALETTPETLQNYHLAQPDNNSSEPTDWFRELLIEKESIIEQQKGELLFLKNYLNYVKTVFRKFGVPFRKPTTDL